LIIILVISTINCISDIDECSEGSHSCTGPTNYCTNKDGGYDCGCSGDGYKLDDEGSTCVGKSLNKFHSKARTYIAKQGNDL
jgi:hypothetical protein